MEKDIRDEVKKLNLGRKIKDLRLKRKLTLQRLAEETGLSKPLLSQIENNIAAPPIATLLKISRALSVDIGFFFQEEEAEQKVVLIRQQERKKTMERVHEEGHKVGYLYEALAYKRRNKHMEPFLVEFEPKGPQEMIFYNHKGEEFIYLLEGELEFRAGDQVYTLKPGDSLYFDSDTPHAFRGLRNRKARAVAVIYSRS